VPVREVKAERPRDASRFQARANYRILINEGIVVVKNEVIAESPEVKNQRGQRQARADRLLATGQIAGARRDRSLGVGAFPRSGITPPDRTFRKAPLCPHPESLASLPLLPPRPSCERTLRTSLRSD